MGNVDEGEEEEEEGLCCLLRAISCCCSPYLCPSIAIPSFVLTVAREGSDGFVLLPFLLSPPRPFFPASQDSPPLPTRLLLSISHPLRLRAALNRPSSNSHRPPPPRSTFLQLSVSLLSLDLSSLGYDVTFNPAWHSQISPSSCAFPRPLPLESTAVSPFSRRRHCLKDPLPLPISLPVTPPTPPPTPAPTQTTGSTTHHQRANLSATPCP